MRLASLPGDNPLILFVLAVIALPASASLDGKKDHKWAYIDPAGKVVLRLSYPYLGQFHDARAAFRSGGGGCDWGYIDKTGKPIVAPKYDYAGDYAEGLAAVSSYETRESGYLRYFDGRVRRSAPCLSAPSAFFGGKRPQRCADRQTSRVFRAGGFCIAGITDISGSLWRASRSGLLE